MADLLAEAGGPAPAFAAVVCEDINRSARDTFNALKLEKELAAGGITLFATNEPVFLEGANATTILLRRMKQRHRRVLPAADQRGLLEGPDRAHQGRVERRPGPLQRGLGVTIMRSAIPDRTLRSRYVGQNRRALNRSAEQLPGGRAFGGDSFSGDSESFWLEAGGLRDCQYRAVPG
jgi:hypothetical protein